jgi:hypothetical protein
MTSIDFSNYVDLTLFDTDANAILNDILTAARGLLPSWQPEAGNIEVVIAEAIAASAADLSAYINRLPDATAETLLQLFAITRSDGVKATANVLVTMVDTVGYTLVADTPLSYFSVGGRAYVYYTDSDLIVPNGSSTGTVAVTAQKVGTGYNIANNGDALQVLATVPYLSTLAFSSNPAGGTSAETDAVYFDRATNLLASYSSAVTTTSQIQSYVLANYAAAYRCVVFNKRRYRDRDTTATGYGEHPGYVTLAVAGQNSIQSDLSDVTVAPSALAAISLDIENRSPAGLIADMMSAELVKVAVTADFNVLTGFDVTEITTNVNTALDTYLDPNTWDWSKQYVRVNEIISLIDGVTGVDFVETVTLAATAEIGTSNFTVSGDVQLHNLGTLVATDDHTLAGTAS